MESKLAAKFSVKSGRSLAAIPGLEFGCGQKLTLIDLLDTANRVFNQREMNMLPLQAVLVIKTLRVDQRPTTFPVLRKDFLSVPSPDVFAKLGKLCPRPRQRNDILG